jgi:Subtilase family
VVVTSEGLAGGGEVSLPLLLLPTPRSADRTRLQGRPGPRLRVPSPERQAERLSPKFQTLVRTFDARRADLQAQIVGAEPEQVLVLETINAIDGFLSAVSRIEGLDFLGEIEEEDLPPDDDFYREDNPERLLPGTLYLVMTNQQALTQLLSLWDRYRANPTQPFEYGLNRFRTLFGLLRDIRPWGPEDRLRETGLVEDWRERVAHAQEVLPAEVELWFRSQEEARTISEESVRSLINNEGGRVVSRAVIEDIRYHAVLAELPISAVERILDNAPNVQLIRSDQVMFFRPTGQTIWTPPEMEVLPAPSPEAADLDARQEEPVIALLDGLPLERHSDLSGMLIVDDPDAWASSYPARERRHGTAMASLILHGDLSTRGPAPTRPVYVRPVMRPDERAWIQPRPERVPDNVLAVDLIHRAVRRMFEGDGPIGPTAPSVRIISLSLGDPAHPFSASLSSWARLLDWLTWRYSVLVLVSAGNHPYPIELPVSTSQLSSMSSQDLQAKALQAIADDGLHRRILAPAEAVNSVCIGSAHSDESGSYAAGTRREMISSPSLCSPFSGLGLGFRRSVKPDVLMPGGRQLYEPAPAPLKGQLVFHPSHQPRVPPGQQVAVPGRGGIVSGREYWHGTSNAAALAAHTAGELYDVLVGLRADSGGRTLSDETLPVALKALLVHGASWDKGFSILDHALNNRVSADRFREYVCRFLGYGRVTPSRVFGSTPQRATMIGVGELQKDASAIFSVPLPPSLSGRREWRRLTITLAWFTPTNSRDRRYRRARLWFEPPRQELLVNRQQADWRAVRRGTVQHEILEGSQATAYADRDALAIQINCAELAGSLTERVPYALAVSLEVAPELDLPVFQEIRDRVRALVQVTPAP